MFSKKLSATLAFLCFLSLAVLYPWHEVLTGDPAPPPLWMALTWFVVGAAAGANAMGDVGGARPSTLGKKLSVLLAFLCFLSLAVLYPLHAALSGDLSLPPVWMLAFWLVVGAAAGANATDRKDRK